MESSGVMILGIGIDIIEIKRVEKASKSQRFMDRVYTSREQDYFHSRKGNPQTIAGSFAAKEAVCKALGTGFGPIKWLEVEILHNQEGGPYVVLHGNASVEMEKLGGKRIWVSISHSRQYAVAQAVVEG